MMTSVTIGLRRAFAIAALTMILAAPTPAAAQGRNTACSVVGQNLFVRDAMTDIYLWSDAVPNVDPAIFGSPEAYLEAVRYLPLDHTFSYITPRASNDAFYSDSQFIGYGLSTSTADGGMRVLQVFAGSPAEEAGLARGDRIQEINGRSIADLRRDGELEGAFGPSQIGVERDVAFTHGGAPVMAHMVKRLVTIPTVSLTRIYRVGSRTVGYVFFRNFVEPSFAALDAAFSEMRDAGVNELVLDLRYNGGGLVSVAQHLASLIGGSRTDGQVFATYFHNRDNAFRNRTIRFEPKANALAVDRVFVITTQGSASASELVINALRPFIPVILIGDRTYGKPVGQYQFPFCDKVLAPVSFSLKNAAGEGDFFDGLQPTCTAADDAAHQLGDESEASLHEAFVFVETGRCSTAQPAAAARRQRASPDRPLAGWQALLGAF
uniref:Putative carboxy-terminal processing protease n=1 Tax=uncultured bacterium 98 TaxID=698395 RepID=E3T6L4_9BACT|nr:putative carboxy-terminal processing protease [uncultured bacterium 98]